MDGFHIDGGHSLDTVQKPKPGPGYVKTIQGVDMLPFGTHRSFNDVAGKFKLEHIAKKPFRGSGHRREDDLEWAKMTSKRMLSNKMRAQTLSVDCAKR